MKRYLLFLLILMSWQYATARVVTESQARKLAADFFTSLERSTKAARNSPEDFKLVYSFPAKETRSSAAEPTLYVYAREYGGYAIIAGDDVARTILGYSLKGAFPVSDMPDNMQTMLQWYGEVIEYAREQKWESSQNTVASSGLDSANAVLLHTAKWSQSHPFNDLVPLVDGKKPPIGCVATAISIIMRYHKWPQRGIGNLPSYDYTYNGTRYHIEGYQLGHEYDWSKMPENYQNCSEEEAAQIARLLYDVAVMCKMAFRPGGSGASDSDVLWLPEYFDYDKQMVYLDRNRTELDSHWEQYIIKEIDAGRPVLYSGGNSSIGGHAFVIDGYNGCYFSINYGWGGGTSYREGHDTSADLIDFYTLRPIDGHEEDLLVFNEYQSMAIGIMPNQGGEADPFMAIGVMDDPHIPCDFKINKSFSLHYGITNYSVTRHNQVFRYILFNCSGEIKEMVSSDFSVTIPERSGTSGYVLCKITKKLDEGDQILLCMKDPSSGEWIPIRQSRKNRIVFTTRQLSELVQINYVEEPQFPNLNSPEKLRDISVESYRDCLWEIYGEDKNKVMDNAGWINGEMNRDDLSYRGTMSDPEDLQCDMVIHEIWLPTGVYTLHLRNPATGEEMEIKLEV